MACVPASKVWHVGGASLEQGNPRKTFLNFRNNLMMLYKNLPEHRLRPVMRLRFWLDYLAALRFLLGGDRANAAAVRRARKEFFRLRPELAADRARNLSLTVEPQPAGLTAGSLLAAYYIKGKKRFSQL